MMAEASRRTRVAVAGTGAFGLEHLERLVARSDTQVVGIADSNPAALAEAQRRHDIAHCFSDPLKLIDQAKPDAIIIATSSPSHVPLAQAAIERNIHVLLEKPVATSAQQAIELLNATKASDAFILPGHVLRFSADHVSLVDIVQSGKIGKTIYVNSRRYRDDTHASRYQDTDPVLMTLIHDIDLALWVAKSPFSSVRAWRSEGSGFRSMTAAAATSRSGVCCELRTAWTFTGIDLPPDRLEVVGSQGSVELEVGRTLRVYINGLEKIMPLATGDDPLANEQSQFLGCVRDRRLTPALSLADAVAGLKLADAIRNSLKLGREVAVEE